MTIASPKKHGPKKPSPKKHGPDETLEQRSATTPGKSPAPGTAQVGDRKSVV